MKGHSQHIPDDAYRSRRSSGSSTANGGRRTSDILRITEKRLQLPPKVHQVDAYPIYDELASFWEARLRCAGSRQARPRL